MLHLFNVDVRLVEAVEENNSRRTVGIQLIDQCYGISQVVTQFHDDRNAYRFFDVAENINVTLFKRTVCILYVRLQSQNIDLYRIGSGFFYLFGKVYPFGITVTVNAGNDRNRAYLFAFFYQSQIFG